MEKGGLLQPSPAGGSCGLPRLIQSWKTQPAVVSLNGHQLLQSILCPHLLLLAGSRILSPGWILSCQLHLQKPAVQDLKDSSFVE